MLPARIVEFLDCLSESFVKNGVENGVERAVEVCDEDKHVAQVF